MPIRLIDAGKTSAVRSQTLYHAIAHARTPDTPDTILFVTPEAPYVSIGYHQDANRVVDLDYCRTQGIPVVRREVGGGLVYLDSDQLFIQWIFQADHLPWRLERRFEFFATPLIHTYHALGIEAYFRPPNDIQVSGKKISGLGAGGIGNAEVMVGNILFDFDSERMSRVLKVPGEEFREQVYKSLLQYLTTIRHESENAPELKTVQEIYISECQKLLQDMLEPGHLTDEERNTVERLDEHFASESWLGQGGGLSRPGTKIHSDVWLYDNEHRAKNGYIRAILRVRNGRVDDLSLFGDIPSGLNGRLHDLERAIIGTELNAMLLSKTIDGFFYTEGIPNRGIRTEDWVHVLLKHLEPARNSSGVLNE